MEKVPTSMKVDEAQETIHPAPEVSSTVDDAERRDPLQRGTRPAWKERQQKRIQRIRHFTFCTT